VEADISTVTQRRSTAAGPPDDMGVRHQEPVGGEDHCRPTTTASSTPVTGRDPQACDRRSDPLGDVDDGTRVGVERRHLRGRRAPTHRRT
jgi:hypothetical protein